MLSFPLVLGLGCSDGPDGIADSARADTGPEPCETPGVWYADLDGDGVGDAASSVEACEAPDAYVASAGDCDDGDAARYPGASDDPCDGVDADCMGDEDVCAFDLDDGVEGVLLPEEGTYGFSVDPFPGGLVLGVRGEEDGSGAAYVWEGPIEGTRSVSEAGRIIRAPDDALAPSDFKDVVALEEGGIAVGDDRAVYLYDAEGEEPYLRYVANDDRLYLHLHDAGHVREEGLDLLMTVASYGDYWDWPFQVVAAPSEGAGERLDDEVEATIDKAISPKVLGDTDGDGIDDISVLQQEVYIFRGPLQGDYALADADAYFAGLGFGNDVLPAGDWDGDGRRDVALRYEQNGEAFGAVYPVTIGGTPPTSEELVRFADPGNGAWPGLGDMDVQGDGWPDMLIGTSSGEAFWLVSGPASGTLEFSSDQPHFYLPEEGVRWVRTDLDDDGRSELLMDMFEPNEPGELRFVGNEFLDVR